MHDVHENLFDTLLMEPAVHSVRYDVFQESGVVDRAALVGDLNARPVRLIGHGAICLEQS